MLSLVIVAMDEADRIERCITSVPFADEVVVLDSGSTDVRKIELLDLTGCIDPKARNYRQYFVRSDPKRCDY